MVTNILEYLERAAERTPNKVVFGDIHQEISYKEAVNKAKMIGTALAQEGLKNSPIVVGTDHSVDCLILFLGIVYSGNFYVPVDIKLPLARIQAILSVSAPKVLLAPQTAVDKFRGIDPGIRVIAREELLGRGDSDKGMPGDKATANDKVVHGDKVASDDKGVSGNKTASESENVDESKNVQGETAGVGEINEALLADIRSKHLDTDPLYLIFTSGSTGVPKGVLISHRSVIDLVEQFAAAFDFSENDVFANQAPFDFDVSVKDIYNTLRNGASLYLVPQSMFSMPKGLVPYLNEHHVTTIIWAVSALSILATVRALGSSVPQYLNKIMFSGEVMPVKVLNYWREYLPEAMYVNLYGPTEITCNCTYYILDREFTLQDTIPIGKAFTNTEILLLDENDCPVPQGTAGEICVRGSSLALGYYRNEEATAKAFRQNPLNPNYPEKIYHTGDYGFYDNEGNLNFAARRDWQIKHMGHRIELSEIETAVNGFSQIERCCCQYDEEHGKIQLIYQSEEPCDKQILKDLQEILPKYMCPNRLTWMKRMPQNQRGKIDRVFLKQRFLPQKGQMLYKEAIVLGTGTLSLRCAELLNEKKVHCEIIDSGDEPSLILERQAERKGISVRRSGKEELAAQLSEICTPTLVISAINPWIVPEKVIENPYLLLVNCHQALLPQHPGRNAEMWAIYDGDESTGITWHLLTEKVDGGEILIQKEFALGEKSTSFSVFRKQIKLAGDAFAEILDSLIEGTYAGKAQKGERGRFHSSKEVPEDGELKLDESYEKISAFLRAFDYCGLPVVKEPWFTYEGEHWHYGGYSFIEYGDYAQVSSAEKMVSGAGKLSGTERSALDEGQQKVTEETTQNADRLSDGSDDRSRVENSVNCQQEIAPKIAQEGDSLILRWKEHSIELKKIRKAEV